MDAPIYHPSAWQKAYHSLTVDEALGAGAAGPGKSICLLLDVVPRIMMEHERCEQKTELGERYPLKWGQSLGWAVHFRRTRPMLEQTIQRSQRIFKELDPGARWDTQHSTWHFSSGYKVTYGHCRNDDDWGNHLSNQYDHMAFDELTQFNEEQYDQLILRVRSDDPLLRQMQFVRSMSNPFIKRELSDDFTVNDPTWVKRKFVDPAPAGGVIIKRPITMGDGRVVHVTRIYLRAQLYDNPNKQFVEDYERKLRSAKPHLRDAYLFGRWDVTVGSHFGDEWNDRLHICKPFKISSDWPVFRSMDWGYKKPGCVHWWALDEDDNLFGIYELTFKMKSPRDVAMMVERYEKSQGWWDGRKSRLIGPADTQLWEARGDIVAMTKAEEFAAAGVPWVQADKVSRYRNAQLMMDRLMDHGNGTTTPGLVFFDTCQNAIRTIPGIPSDEKDPEMPKDGGDDHWYDSTAYACAYASRGRKGVRALPRKREAWEEENVKKAMSFGRHGYGGY